MGDRLGPQRADSPRAPPRHAEPDSLRDRAGVRGLLSQRRPGNPGRVRAGRGSRPRRAARGHEFWPAWEQWLLGNALAHLVITPAILYWVFGPSWELRAASARRWLEGAVLAIGIVVSGYLAFNTESGSLSFAEPRFYA